MKIVKNSAPNSFCLAFLLLIIPVITSCRGGETETPARPNVLIIFTDDLGYGDVSCYDDRAKAQTPLIDRLAEEGVRCTDFYVPTPYCAPSRATLLTGRFPLRHGLIRNPTPDQGIDSIGIPADEITLGEVFREAGYRTSLIGKWHLGHREQFFPVRHGFDEYYGILYSNDMRPVQIVEGMDTVPGGNILSPQSIDVSDPDKPHVCHTGILLDVKFAEIADTDHTHTNFFHLA